MRAVRWPLYEKVGSDPDPFTEDCHVVVHGERHALALTSNGTWDMGQVRSDKRGCESDSRTIKVWDQRWRICEEFDRVELSTSDFTCANDPKLPVVYMFDPESKVCNGRLRR